MMIETSAGTEINSEMLSDYFRNLVNLFFKILPIREQNEESLTTYMQSLQAELLGFKSLICAIESNALFITLLSILQYLIDHHDCPVSVVKREVFRAISICNKLKSQYAEK